MSLAYYENTAREGVVIGLDIGGTITKIVGFSSKGLLDQARVRSSDPVASAFGAVGKFIQDNGLKLSEVREIRATGVGASYLNGNIFECRTIRVPEFNATGLGGLYVADVEKAVVVSMGTGTSIVYANQKEVRHIIGSGVGGGTLTGLSAKMLNVRDFSLLAEMANRGSLENVDLSIQDISGEEIPGLSGDTTASNFGKTNDLATADDLACGLVNMVFQSVGTASVLAARIAGVKTIVFTGNLLKFASGKDTLHDFSKLYDVKILTPDMAEFATAIGAALLRVQNN